MPALRTRDTHARSLEVTVDDELKTPTMNIISPTPRAFTFPMNKPLAPSPSNSPFESDLRQLTLTPAPKKTHTPSSSISSDASFLSIESTPQTSPAAPARPRRRRRSTADEINERRPKKGDGDYIKRPENAFILFRRKCCEDRNNALDALEAGDGDKSSLATKKQRQADLSKAISLQWKQLSAEDRKVWEDLAKRKKKEHEEMYPHYVYRPQRVKGKKGSGKGKEKDEQEAEADGDGLSFVLGAVPANPRLGRRAASAPTPPLAFQQTIHLPQLLMQSTPSSPSNFSGRRESYESSQGSIMDYEYESTDFLPESFGQPQGWNPDIHGGDMVPVSFELSHQMFNEKQSAAPLHSLMISDQPLFEPMRLISPTSLTADSSGPPSPHHGPWTPHMLETVQIPADAWQRQEDLCMPHVSGMPAHDSGGAPQLGYQPYAWDGTMWMNGPEPVFNEDFDVNGIPPIELDVPKFDMTPTNGCHSEQQMPMGIGYGNDGREADPFMATFNFDELNMTTERF